MKYRAKHLRFNGTFWTCTLEWWEGCECNKESKKVEIHSVKRPSLKDIKEAVIWYLFNNQEILMAGVAIRH